MKKRCIIVSGSSSGIGRAICELLIEEGVKVIGLSRNQKKFNPQSDLYQHYECDTENFIQLQKVFSTILLDYPRID